MINTGQSMPIPHFEPFPAFCTMSGKFCTKPGTFNQGPQCAIEARFFRRSRLLDTHRLDFHPKIFQCIVPINNILKAHSLKFSKSPNVPYKLRFGNQDGLSCKMSFGVGLSFLSQKRGYLIYSNSTLTLKEDRI